MSAFKEDSMSSKPSTRRLGHSEVAKNPPFPSKPAFFKFPMTALGSPQPLLKSLLQKYAQGAFSDCKGAQK